MLSGCSKSIKSTLLVAILLTTYISFVNSAHLPHNYALTDDASEEYPLQIDPGEEDSQSESFEEDTSFQDSEDVSSPEEQEVLKKKHVTSPTVEDGKFDHFGDMTVFHPYIEMDKQGARQRRNAVNHPDALWPGGIVPYEISSQFSASQRSVIFQSMQHWEDNTCIRFRPKVSTDIYSIYIMRDVGCYSFVGRIPRRYQPQGVSLGTNCVYNSVVIHELGHAIGFYHEHTRPDRNQYIDVIYDNIIDGQESNFRKFQPGQTNTLGLGYDLQSIMHYRRNTFSIDGSDTIRAKVPTTSFGVSRQLSPLDIAKANALYKCPDTSPPTTPISCGGELNTASGSFQTPNWPETYPVDIDCEWKIKLPDTRKLVEIKCEEDPYGIAGTYPSCTKDHLTFYDGHSKQDNSHGPYCHFTTPGTLKMSSNLAMAVFNAGPSHSPSRRGFKCTFQSVDAPTISPPTLPPPPPTTPSLCGGKVNTASGSFQTPNWPETYPVNINCEWTIELPDSSKLVELTCEQNNYGIAGTYPSCTKDHLTFYDGHSKQDDSHGPYCHFTTPDTLKMSSNKAMAVFNAGPSHSSSRRGFKCNFRSVDGPTSQCGGTLTASSGSFQSPNWPSTYPVNVDCEWRITLPNSNNRVELEFDTNFGIAGSLPECVKDHVKIYDDRANTVYGPYCYFTTPSSLRTSSNEVRIVLHAGPAHSPSRRGFKVYYRSV